jgi:hypothetical protein
LFIVSISPKHKHPNRSNSRSKGVRVIFAVGQGRTNANGLAADSPLASGLK